MSGWIKRAGGRAGLRAAPEFGAYMVSEMNKWEKVVKQGGIKEE